MTVTSRIICTGSAGPAYASSSLTDTRDSTWSSITRRSPTWVLDTMDLSGTVMLSGDNGQSNARGMKSIVMHELLRAYKTLLLAKFPTGVGIAIVFGKVATGDLQYNSMS